MIAPARDLETTPSARTRDAGRQRHRRSAAPLLPPPGPRPAPSVAAWKAWLLATWIVGLTAYYLWTLSEALLGP